MVISSLCQILIGKEIDFIVLDLTIFLNEESSFSCVKIHVFKGKSHIQFTNSTRKRINEPTMKQQSLDNKLGFHYVSLAQGRIEGFQ
jgi:hypothetical protein